VQARPGRPVGRRTTAGAAASVSRWSKSAMIGAMSESPGVVPPTATRRWRRGRWTMLVAVVAGVVVAVMLARAPGGAADALICGGHGLDVDSGCFVAGAACGDVGRCPGGCTGSAAAGPHCCGAGRYDLRRRADAGRCGPLTLTVLIRRHAAQWVTAMPRGDLEGLVNVVDREGRAVYADLIGYLGMRGGLRPLMP
jgi:hypothetical protein